MICQKLLSFVPAYKHIISDVFVALFSGYIDACAYSQLQEHLFYCEFFQLPRPSVIKS